MVVKFMSLKKFDEIVKDFNKENKAEIITAGIKEQNVQRIQFSSPYLNYMLHGGFPRGRVVEFFGTEGSGKTTTALDVFAGAQEIFNYEWQQEVERFGNSSTKADVQKKSQLLENGPQKCVFIDLEHTLDKDWAEKIGVNIEENFYYVSPLASSAEEILDLIIDFAKSGEVGLIVLDSICYLVPEAQVDVSLEKKEYGGVSKVLSTFLKKVTPYLNQNNVSLLLINQLRDSMDPYKLYETPGGRALKFACSLRLYFQKGMLLNENFEPVPRKETNPMGVEVLVKIEKTKICKPDRPFGTYRISFNTGIEWIYDLYDVLISYGHIVASGSWVNFFHPETGELIEDAKVQGRLKAVDLLRNNGELLELYLNAVSKKIKE